MNIAVFLGGLSTERDISIKSGTAVFKALKELGHNPIIVDPALGKDGFFFDIEDIKKLPRFSELDKEKFSPKKYLEAINFATLDDVEFAFVVLHGKFGEDGTIQTLLEFKGIPYSGSGPKASAIGLDKNLSKILFTAAGIPTPKWTIVRATETDNFELCNDLRNEFGKQLIIKPNDQGSTVGTTIVFDGNLDEIHNGLKNASKYSDIVIIEEYIAGKEITVGIVESKALPIIEIVPESGFYDFEHKYTKGKSEYICPAELPDDVTEFVQDLALSAFHILGCKGFARVDFRLNEDFQPFVLEINTIPGFTETSLVPMAALTLGIDFPTLCQKIIDESLK
jgi:D-alanine-D-alanine ligase